jgi:hypothetical protein
MRRLNGEDDPDGPRSPVGTVPNTTDRDAGAHLPKEAERWDYLGTFRLNDCGEERAVVLCCFDTDWAVGCTPNLFALHAVYQGVTGNWVHEKVFSGSRVGFGKVGDSSPEAVSLELHGKCSFIRPGVPRVAEGNRPFVLRLSFENGVPVITPRAKNDPWERSGEP